MLGIDGIGKTSLARALSSWIEARGWEVETVSWRRAVTDPEAGSPYPRRAVEELWVEDWRLLYGGGTVGGRSVDEMIPRSFDGFQKLDVEELFPLVADDVRSSGPLASGLVEAALDFVLEAEIVRPLSRRGCVSIRESFGFKPVLKSLLIALRCRPGTIPHETIESVIEQVTAQYANPFLQPDFGIFIDGPAELAYERRSAQGRGIGIAEDYGLAGHSGASSFIELQEECNRRFRAVSERWGWRSVTVDGATSVAELAERVIESGLADLLDNVRVGG